MRTVHSLLTALAIACICFSRPCLAFVPPRPPNSHLGHIRHGDGSNEDGSSFGSILLGGCIFKPFSNCNKGEGINRFSPDSKAHCLGEEDGDLVMLMHVRGGGIGGGVLQKISEKRQDAVNGFRDAIDDTISYWRGAFAYLDSRLLPGGRARQGDRQRKADDNPSRKEKPRRGRMSKEEKEALKQMETVTVNSVSAPKSTVLPSSVLTDAGTQSGLIGGAFCAEAVEECAGRLGKWYSDSGYILNSVTGATLDADTGTAQMSVEEATVAIDPVDIVNVREMSVDISNSTLVPTKAKVRPKVLAEALNLHAGEPFRWDRDRWDGIDRRSGLFSRVWSVSPQKSPDGTVQLRIIATEAPARSIDYGITKSLYNDVWEGEIDCSHGNLLGGGERLGISIRRGTREPQPSFNIKFAGNTLAEKGPYSVEAFSEFIGVDGHEGGVSSRRGLRMRIRNPIPHTMASISTEKTLAKANGADQDFLAHSNFDVGPFYQKLPGNGRSNLQALINIGAKIDPKTVKKGVKPILNGMSPYFIWTAITRQMFPLGPVALAFQHRATSSTADLPEHEALALGFGSRVRGYSPKLNGPLSSSCVGTAEVRVPISLPQNKVMDDGSLVLFGDWMIAQQWNKTARDAEVNPQFKSCCASIGIGIRSLLQDAIPVKVDFSLTGDGKLGTHFALGRDFAV